MVGELPRTHLMEHDLAGGIPVTGTLRGVDREPTPSFMPRVQSRGQVFAADQANLHSNTQRPSGLQ